MVQNLKVVIDNKAFDVVACSSILQVYFFADRPTLPFYDAKEVLRGTTVEEYDYHKNGDTKEIFEGDTIRFFDLNNNVLDGIVFWDDKRLQWRVDCLPNIHGWAVMALCDVGLPTIVKRKYER
ncbi:MAG: hypothetical protein LBL00_08810 [Endomicrobium sp.]|jgi:hypothetical protein|nr:hypothetical protein [Endomicrobium sp.]